MHSSHEITRARAGIAKLAEGARHARDLLEHYEDAISGINGRTFLPGRFLRKGFFDRFTGMRNVLASMGALAVSKPGVSGYVRVEEWNPIAQRPIARRVPPFARERRSFAQEFEDLREIYDNVVTLMHEAMHVVMWEPFFTGRVRPSEKTFVEASNAFEGFCFFYADIVVCSQIEAQYPDGLVIYGKRGVSQPDFSPVSVFRTLGIREPEKILDAYLSALAGRASVLTHPTTKTPFARLLAMRLYPISVAGAKANAKVYAHLEKTGITSTFYDRYCAVRGIPSLLPADLLRLDARDPHPYCADMFARGLRAIADRSSSEIARVRTRRMLQTRAYYAHQLRWILEERLAFCPRHSRSAPFTRSQGDQWLRHLASYLDEIEALLLLLCASTEGPEAIERRLLRADRTYEDAIRRPLVAADLWVRRRELIFPAMPVPAVDLDALPASSAELAGLYQFVVRVAAARFDAREQMRVMKDFFSGEAGAKLTDLLTREGIRDTWSVPLAAIDPLRNGFRELLFLYE